MIDSEVTILIPTSPIPSCPSTRIIDETIASVREQLPDARIALMIDGPIGGVEYERYVEALRQKHECHLWPEDHPHQSGMIGTALEFVRTPLLLYLEHDWRLLPNIEWSVIAKTILSGHYNYVKLHAGARIHPLHEHLMLAREIIDEVPFIRTRQWSQNPHLASTEFYRRLYREYLRDKTDFIENCLAGIVSMADWEKFRCAVYNPILGDMKRVHHLDGRGSE